VIQPPPPPAEDDLDLDREIDYAFERTACRRVTRANVGPVRLRSDQRALMALCATGFAF
jgi:hypothetical protein